MRPKRPRERRSRCQNRDPRQGGEQRFDDLAGESADEEAADDGYEDHLHDRDRHGLRIDGHVGAGEPPGEERSHERGEQRRDRGHRDGERDVSLREVGDDVRGGASGRAADEDHADRDRCGQLEDPREEHGEQGHDDELRDDADEHRKGSFHDEFEVGDLQGEAHAEHDDAEGVVRSRGEGVEHRGCGHRRDEGGDDHEGEDRDRDSRGTIFIGRGRAVFGGR